MYYCRLIYKLCLHKCTASSSQLPYYENLSASLEISLSYQAVYQHLLDNIVSGPLFVPTVITALYPSNIVSPPSSCKCDSILKNQQIYFQASDYKERNFLELNNNDNKPIYSIYFINRVWLKHFGLSNTLYVYIMRLITVITWQNGYHYLFFFFFLFLFSSYLDLLHKEKVQKSII